MVILRVTREAEGIRRRLSVAKIADSGEEEGVLHAVAENESTLAPLQEPDQAVKTVEANVKNAEMIAFCDVLDGSH